MPEQSKPRFCISARQLAEFLFRSGDLGGKGGFSGGSSALDGIRAHQKLQKNWSADHETEVFISHLFERDSYTLKISGRADGLLRKGSKVVIQEIKTLQGSTLPTAPDACHIAQAKIYAALLRLQDSTLQEFEIRMTYLALLSDELRVWNFTFSSSEIDLFTDSMLREYFEWTDAHDRWIRQRDQSINAAAFPFSKYRPGQRQLAVQVFKCLKAGKQLFAEAPTGLGKTISTLFPAIKALPEIGAKTIFYLTAKTPGRQIAESALDHTRASGLRFRSVTLTARDKICFNSGNPCDVQACPYAVGYYDRIKKALWDILQSDNLGRTRIEEIARIHQVCPFELSLDASLWADAVICDFNYVFDPQVSLKRFFDADNSETIVLVDEAHNLLERARAMFSAEISTTTVTLGGSELRKSAGRCARAFTKLRKALSDLNSGTDQAPHTVAALSQPLLSALEKAVERAEEWLVLNENTPFRADLLQAYFEIRSFLLVARELNDCYSILVTPAGKDVHVRLFCLDPAAGLARQLAKTAGALFFSATLTPLDFYRETLGGDSDAVLLQLPSPFPPQNLEVRVERKISTAYRTRDKTHRLVAQSIAAFIREAPGNTLVYFSSYKYLEAVQAEFRSFASDNELLLQSPGMSEENRTAFINRFRTGKTNVIGFALMGGFFGEGIDLGGDTLRNVVVVGVGLPQVGLEREEIRRYFQARNGFGFEYAYLYPGMNRVIQAVGRLIRSETDQGRALLIDTRFAEPRFYKLFPPAWLG